MQTVVNLRTEYLVVVNVTISGAQRWDTSRRFLLDPRYIPDTSLDRSRILAYLSKICCLRYLAKSHVI
jgi:hypothetical protein